MTEEAKSEPASEVGTEKIHIRFPAGEATSGDAMDGTLIASGEVTSKGKSHQLLLTHKGLRLLPSQSGSNAGAEAPNTPVVDVPWREVVCACEPPVKKSKSIAKEGMRGGGGDGGAPSKVFVVHYMVRNLKTYRVQCRSITLESTQESAEGWIMQIEEKRKEGKPQKLLVIVNPIGGKGNARQLLKTRVQPLFALAGVELVVRVTERAKHAVEIAKTFDVSSVDGVIVMGGDGLYMEVLHALTLRKQEEEGVDFNNPDTTLIPPNVRVGIIPAGTGNGVSGFLNGVVDVNTATLNIMRGETNRINIFALHEGTKLIQYSGLHIANGYFSSLIKRTEELRWMKTLRYPYAMISHMLRKKKVVEFDIEVLKNEQEQGNRDEAAKAEAAEAAEASGWSRLSGRQLTASMAFPAAFEEKEDGFVINPFSAGFDAILINNTATGMDHLRFLYAFVTQNKSGLERPFTEWVHNLQGIRFQMVQPPAEGAASSSQQTELTELSKLVNVDGECIPLSEPKFEFRLHSQFLQVFSYPSRLAKVRESPPSGKDSPCSGKKSSPSGEDSPCSGKKPSPSDKDSPPS